MTDHNRPHSYSPASGSALEPDRADLTNDFSGPDPAASVSVATLTSPLRLNAGRYQMLAEIAHGGMGVIWRAVDTALGREVAVKVLQDKFAPDSGTARRFAAEARCKVTANSHYPYRFGVSPIVRRRAGQDHCQDGPEAEHVAALVHLADLAGRLLRNMLTSDDDNHAGGSVEPLEELAFQPLLRVQRCLLVGIEDQQQGC